MTTIYVPRLIESAEQAEALPQGTIAHRVLEFESTWETITQPEVAMKIGLNAWHSTAIDADSWDWLDQHLVGWTALVPIEVEEEWTGGGPGLRMPMHDRECAEAFSEPIIGGYVARRLVTPWEETP